MPSAPTLSETDTRRFAPYGLTDREIDAWEKRLDELCGDAPRRISCWMAITATMPTAASSCFMVNTPALFDGITNIDGYGIRHFRENADTIFHGSLHISEKTRISMRERALLDCLEYSRSYKSVKLVLQSMDAVAPDPEKMIEIAEAVDARDSVRRIVSIASLLRHSEHRRGWIETLEDYSRTLPRDEVYLLAGTEPAGANTFWDDEEHAVVWDIPPRSIYCDVYYF